MTEAPPFLALLLDELSPVRPTSIVDVGANPINVPPYAPLLASGGCVVTGFEPQPEAFAALQERHTPNERYLPHAVGNGETMELKVMRSSGMTSLLEPYMPGLTLLGHPRWGKVQQRIEMETVRLDSLEDLGPIDLLKIDIQGAELMVIEAARRALSEAVAVIVELRYLRLYVGEPMMGGLDLGLRDLGFGLHKFLFNKSVMVPNSQSGRLRSAIAQDQLVDGDAVYVKDISHFETFSDEQLKHLALLAASTFQSYPLAIRCLDELAARGIVAEDLAERFVTRLDPQLLRPSRRSDDGRARTAPRKASRNG
ncbi:FkbM family methyltransferase [Tabrizicola sp. J26]|uniref:FkbM family methyltransferase n=1 Tax=Alitabrizicola rongguiensis TaxID=2909234 RepID=UPI001F1D4654|nr:FkbM family methyltransferase [Tabrizicola rongguiensis]MCF1709503.1 FkbM family methyltransferase [Tabrizicola rongguiensis]